jgi:hypothetical protein
MGEGEYGESLVSFVLGLMLMRMQLGRISEPSEYRGAALFCLSNASSFMTGTNVSVVTICWETLLTVDS